MVHIQAVIIASRKDAGMALFNKILDIRKIISLGALL